jgi:A/G-specific adenine glycosylase
MKRKDFQEKLLEWYHHHHRQLPFRESPNPYNIWLSEIMLQQTQMDTVLPYYERFIAAFPTIFDLAKAEERHVLKLWEGLGYYSRARNLLKCATVIVGEHDGRFPTDYKTVLKLPGIGPYTAGAILSIAFNQKVPAVDGNVMRVFSRLFNLQQDISVPKNKKQFEKKVRETIPDNARDYNQALMELGALICLPKNPKCDLCPLKEECQAFSLSIQSQLPVKTKKIRNEKIQVAVGICRNRDKILITKTKTALLKNMWGFPIAEGKDKKSAREALQNQLKDYLLSDTADISEIGEAKHVFTHKTWLMTIYDIHIPDTVEEERSSDTEQEDDFKKIWVKTNEIESYAIPTAFKKLLKLLNDPVQKQLPF